MSSKTVAQKLLIKPTGSLWLSHPDRLELLGNLPEGVKQVERPDRADVNVLFVENAASLRELLKGYGGKLSGSATIWFAYPKGNRADINRDSIWPVVAQYGLRPVSQVAVDDVWSALRFRPLKEGEKQFSGGKK